MWDVSISSFWNACVMVSWSVVSSWLYHWDHLHWFPRLGFALSISCRFIFCSLPCCEDYGDCDYDYGGCCNCGVDELLEGFDS